MEEEKDRIIELLRQKQYNIYRKYPLKWVEDILQERPEFYKWSLHGGAYDTHQWDGDKDPISTCWQALADQNWAALAAATGTGKTFTAARIALWFLDVYEDSLVVTSAPKESQLVLNLWGEISKCMPQFKKTRPNSYMTKLNFKVEGLNEDSPFKETHQMVGFVAGVGADEDSANKARGFHRKNMLFIIEETTGVHSAIITAFKNTCTGKNNLIFALGNPNSEHDQLYKFSQLPNVVDCRISAYDYPNVVLGEEMYAGAVTQQSIDRRRDADGEDSPIFKAMVRGITPKDDESSIVKADWVDWADIHGKNFKNYKVLGDAYNGCGIDVAQSLARDKAAISWFRGNVLVRLDEFQCPNANYLAHNLMMSDAELMENGIEKYPTGKLADLDILAGCIGVDAVGVGVATLNTLAENGYDDVIAMSGGAWTDEGIIPIQVSEDGKEKPKYTFANFRSQLYFKAGQDFQHGLVLVDIPDRELFERFKKEISTIRYAMSGNAVAVEKKEFLKKRLGGKSPNLADAFVYGNWAREGYRLMAGNMPFGFFGGR